MKNHLIIILKHTHLNLGLILLLFSIIIIPVSLISKGAYASSTDYFSISPATANYQVGNSINIAISVTANDTINAINAQLSYSSSNLRYNSDTLTGHFTLCGNNSGGNGSINIGCAVSGNGVTGYEAIANLNFTVLAQGTAEVKFVSGSAIVDVSQNNTFNGIYPLSTLSLSNPPAAPSQPISSGGSGNTAPPVSSSGNSRTTRIAPPPTSTSPTKLITAPSNPTSPGSLTAPNNKSNLINSLTITLLSPQNVPLSGVPVIITGSIKAQFTNSKGQVLFKSISPGIQTIHYKYNGNVYTIEHLFTDSSPSQAYSIKVHNTAFNINQAVYIIVTIGILLALIGAIIYWYFRHFKQLRSLNSVGALASPGVASFSSPNISLGGVNYPQVPLVPSASPDLPSPNQIIKPNNISESSNSNNFENLFKDSD